MEGKLQFCGKSRATFFSGYKRSEHKLDDSRNVIDQDIVHESFY